MKLQAILFDMDGTILDSAPDFIVVTNELLAKHQLPAVGPETIRQVVSGGAKAMVKNAFGLTDDDPLLEPLRLEFLALYQQQCAVYSKLYDGMASLLTDLEKSSIRWGIVTNKPVRFAEPIMERLALDTRASVLVCPEHVTHCKPSPEPLLLACKMLAIAPETAIYIGDDQRDIESGNAAGCKTIAVTYGYIHPDDNPHNWGAGAVVDTVKELRHLLDSALCGC